MCYDYNQCSGDWYVDEEEVKELTEQELKELKVKLCDLFIDARCEYDGALDTIEYLMGWDITPPELLALGFDEDDIMEVVKETDVNEEV